MSLFKTKITPEKGHGIILYNEIHKLIPSAKKDKIYLTNPDLITSDKTYFLPYK